VDVSRREKRRRAAAVQTQESLSFSNNGVASAKDDLLLAAIERLGAEKSLDELKDPLP
jgi:hypothetical protein